MIHFEISDRSTGGGLPATATEPASALLHMLGFHKTGDISCHTPGDEGRIARHLFPHSHRRGRLHMFHVPDTVPLLFKLWPRGEARWLRRDCTGRCELVTPDGTKGDHGRLENTYCLWPWSYLGQAASWLEGRSRRNRRVSFTLRLVQWCRRQGLWQDGRLWK